LDGVNARYGRGALLLASAVTPDHKNGLGWTMKQERRTPGYTTQWGELAVARA
jgi:DNA polymerase V